MEGQNRDTLPRDAAHDGPSRASAAWSPVATTAALLVAGTAHAQTDGSETLGSLAREFQNLPIASLAPAAVLLLAGLLLLVAGKHILRPVLVVTTVLLAALVGTPVLTQFFPRLEGPLLVLVAAAAGLVLVAITWRLMLGAATGVVTAFACACLALAGVHAGFIDARSPSDAPSDAITLEEFAEREALVERAPGHIRPLVAWADARWHDEPKQVRTLLGAAAAGGAFIGLVLGTWLPQSSAAFLTSLVGGLFVLIGGMPFLARVVDRAAEPMPPLAWLALWAALALGGWLLQSSRGESDAAIEERDEPGDAAQPQQRATTPAAPTNPTSAPRSAPSKKRNAT
jgi:hypothetical protein